MCVAREGGGGGEGNLPMDEVSKLLLSTLQELVSLRVRTRRLLYESRNESLLLSLAEVVAVAMETSSRDTCRPMCGFILGCTVWDSWYKKQRYKKSNYNLSLCYHVLQYIFYMLLK